LFDTVEEAEIFIKKEFQKMFKNNAKGIFEANPQLFVNKQ